ATPTRVGTSDTLNSGNGDWTAQAGGHRADDFAFRFFGYIVVPVSGEITFYLRSDDGSQLRINGVMVVDNDGLHGTEGFPGDAGKITLAAGAYTIEATQFERGGGESLYVNWSYIGQSARGVPDNLLFLQPPADISPFVVKEAYGPNPANGATEVDIASLEWNAGFGAVSHKVYLSKDETIDAADLVGETTGPVTIQVVAVDPGVTYFWRVDEVAADGTVVQGPVWTFATLPREAHFPSPPDGGTNFLGAKLSWTAGKSTILHNVYLGTNPAALPPVSMMQLNASFTPAALNPNTTYYWRVDEFTPAGTAKGPVWSFSTIGPVTPSGIPDLIAMYQFEEGPSSLSALDTSGKNHHGALLGNAKIDGALILDGNGDCVDAGSHPDYHPAGAFSVSAFINMTSWGGSWSNVIVGTRGESGVGWQLRRHSGNQNLTFTVRGTPGADDPRGTIVPPLNQWIHVAAVFDPAGGTRRVYINGVPDVQIADSGKVAASDHKLYVGARANSGNSGPEAFFNGSIDNLRIYSRALTLSEVRVLAGVEALPWSPDPANGRSGVSTPVVLKWNPGDYAVSQDIYFGTDAGAVTAANAADTTGIYRGRLAETTYAAGDLVWGAGYYWRAD
ncbi:MAG: LamG-like jellyroll fold domain-containing protein, partial [Planctomycetota bacterium]